MVRLKFYTHSLGHEEVQLKSNFSELCAKTNTTKKIPNTNFNGLDFVDFLFFK